MLFCDLKGSSSLSERLDPEDWQDLLTSYRRVCRAAIERCQGHEPQFTGDGVMSYFGYPVAHEDDAVRAVRAALQIIEDLEQVNRDVGRRLQSELHVRVGIDSGVAVVGGVDPGRTHDSHPVGPTLHLAARIQSLASVNTIVVSAATAQLVEGHFELQALGSQTPKGFTKPVELFRVVGATGARSRFEAAASRSLTPYVGRREELSELQDTWREVQGGVDRVVVIRGEAGIGKTRILYQFRRDALRDGARIVECFCSPLAQATAFAPVIEMLDRQVTERAGGKTASDAKLAALRALASDRAGFGPEVVALLATLLSIPGVDDGPIQELSPARRRTNTLGALRSWLASQAAQAPLALLVEDVHWADPSTLDLLDLVVRESPGGRTLLCVTARPEFLQRWSHDHVCTIKLDRLKMAEIEAMVTHVAGGHALPPLVQRGIAERSEGVPLFVEEVTKAALESGALHLEADRYQLTGAFEERSLPATVQGSLLARFDRLGESRNVAQLGAAIGREFAYPLICAVTQMREEVLREHLDALVRSGLVYVDGEAPASTYTFKHALIQDAIYGTLLKSERARVHQRILTALQRGFSQLVKSRPEMAAHHAEHAGRKKAAVPLLLEAGVNAVQRTALAEAVKHLERGLTLVNVIKEPERSRLELELCAALGPAYMATVGWAAPEVERSSTRLRDLAAASGDGPKLFQAMWGLWTTHFLRGQLDAALSVARQVLEMAEAAGDKMLRVTGHHAVGYTHFYRAEYAEAIRNADEGLALFDLEQERKIAAIFQLSSSAALWCFRAQAKQVLGDVAGAAQSVGGAKKLDADLRHAPSRVYLVCLCYYHRLRHDVGEVGTMAMALRWLSAQEGFSLWVLVADIFLAWASAQRGESASLAAEKIGKARTMIHDGLTHLIDAEQASMHAEALLLAHRPEDAFRVAQDALTIIRRGGQIHGMPDLYRLQGEAEEAMGNGKQAVALYRQGIEAARSQGAKLLELRSALALNRLTSSGAKQGEFKELLEALADATDHPDYRRAQALLEKQEASSRQPAYEVMK